VELFTNWHTWPRTEPELRRLLTAATCDAVAKAVEFAIRYHGDQRRPTGAPYLEHLLETLEVLVRGAGVTDPDVLCAAVLHDVVEDTPCTVDDEPADGADRKAAKESYLESLRDAPDDAVLVKLADRASNVQTLRNLGQARQREYYAQTVRYIIPLAEPRDWWAGWYSIWRTEHQDLT
jgi:(p)ppGpp synthase/HD superfamily hydrolase